VLVKERVGLQEYLAEEQVLHAQTALPRQIEAIDRRIGAPYLNM